MKIIIITLYKGSFPFVDELLDQLNKKGVDVCVFDMVDMHTVRLVNGERIFDFHTKSTIFRKLCGIRFLGTILRSLFYKWYLNHIDFSCDHINIHYALPYYSQFIGLFKRKSKSTSVVIWGSDFNRVNNNKRNRMKHLFQNCDNILIPNTQLAAAFTKFYGVGIGEKIKSVGFGIGKLDLIKELSHAVEVNQIKFDLNIPINKLVLTIGYNGLQAQQHLLILEALSDLSKELKNRIMIIIPFGYGGDVGYKNELLNRIKELGIDYHLHDSFISDVDVAKIRICTDIAINAQITDGSSASLQEHIYSGNVLMVGDWLQYNHFSDVGVKFLIFSKENLSEMLIAVLNDFEYYKDNAKNNKDLIYNMSSWNARINQWIELFQNKL